MPRAVIFFALWGQLTRFGQAIARLLFSISDAHRIALEQIKGVRVCYQATVSLGVARYCGPVLQGRHGAGTGMQGGGFLRCLNWTKFG